MEQGGVDVQVRSQLSKIVEDLEKIMKAGAAVSNGMKTLSKDLGKETKEQTKLVEDQLNKTQSFGRRVADQLRKDFQALFAIQSLGAGLKLSEQFSGSIKESVTLSDTVRKLSGVFGIAGNQFIHFQNLMQQGLGEIGASSEAAANALKGLAETPVRGEKNLLQYSKTAAQLASISGEKGNEGGIAKATSQIITSRGGDANNLNQLSDVTEEILKIRRATGKSVSEITAALQDVYSKTNSDFQRNLQGGASVTLASAALQGGPQATTFLEGYLSKSKNERAASEAQGLGKLLNQKGELDPKAFADTMAEANRRMPGNVQGGLQTMGMGADEAKGFMRLSEAMKTSGTVINGAKDAVVDLNAEYKSTMSLSDSFKANINKVKGIFAPLVSAGSQGATELMSHTSGNIATAGAVTAGAGILSAMLVGGGLKGIGKGLGLGGMLGDEAKAKAIEAATGEHVQKVEVVNFPSGFSLPGGPGAASTIAKTVGLTGAGLLAGGAIAATTLVAYQQARIAAEKDPIKQKAIADSGDRAMGNQAANGGQALAEALIGWIRRGKDVNVKIDLKSKELKAAQLPSRGGKL